MVDAIVVVGSAIGIEVVVLGYRSELGAVSGKERVDSERECCSSLVEKVFPRAGVDDVSIEFCACRSNIERCDSCVPLGCRVFRGYRLRSLDEPALRGLVIEDSLTDTAQLGFRSTDNGLCHVRPHLLQCLCYRVGRHQACGGKCHKQDSF